MAKALVTWNTIKRFNDAGEVVDEEIIEFAEPKEDLMPHPEGTCWYPLLGRYLPEDLSDTPMLVDESEIVLDDEDDDNNESPRRIPPPADAFKPIVDANGDVVEEQLDRDETGAEKDEELVTSTEPVFVRLRPKFYKGEKENPYAGLVDPLPSPQELAKHYFWYWESTLYRDPNFVVGKVNDFIEHGINILFREYRELERFVKVVDSIKAADAPLEEKAFVAFAFAGTMTWAAELTLEKNDNAVDWLCYFEAGRHE
ncbi:MAG: hypothetical protein IJG84_18595 [Kiritimatiellae bacterium]|nr:hypothetical protein [Kiritimatiellia bacterium]